jgi:tetratricopeptide (TPR) repeat protein
LEALKIQRTQQYTGVGITQTNIANIYFKQKKLDEAFQCYTEAKISIDKHPNQRALGEWYNNIGSYYNSRKYPELAVENWQKAITTFKEFEDQFGLTDTYLHLGEFYLNQNQLNKALQFANEALDLAISIKVLEQIMVAEKLLSDVYEKNGNSNLALDHYKRFSTAKDSLVKENDVRKEIEAVMNYEFEKKELFRNEENKKRDLLLKEEA